MLFNSYVFIFLFLPITWLVYFSLAKYKSLEASKYWLLASSLFFIGYWKAQFLYVVLTSLVVNFALTNSMVEANNKKKSILFCTGLVFNLGLLCFFKYINFFSGDSFQIILPLGISFYTIQQIAYLVDCYQEEATTKSILDYALFVCFFPHFISGPIVKFDDVNHLDTESKKFNPGNFSLGLFLFSIGLFKKAIIADTLSDSVKDGFSSENLHFFYAWGTSLSYTFQLYFDFSGYTDMAVGIGHMFNIKLPQNFNSPLKATNINDFWSRWHITLSVFIRTYIFTPIQRLMPRPTFGFSMFAMFLAMTLAGIWHGAAWTFLIYGSLHGLAIVVAYNFKRRKFKMPSWLAWFITFNFVNFSFVLFHSESLKKALYVYRGMIGLNGIQLPKMGIGFLLKLKEYGVKFGPYMTNDQNIQLGFIILCFVIIFKVKSTIDYEASYQSKTLQTIAVSILFVLGLFGLNRVSDFIYFNF